MAFRLEVEGGRGELVSKSVLERMIAVKSRHGRKRKSKE